MEKQQYGSIERSIQEILDILNHSTNLPLNGQPPYSPLPEESVRLLNEQLKCLRESLAEMDEVRKKELKLDGLKEEDESYRLKPIQIGDKYGYLFWKTYKHPTEPIIRFEPTRLEPIRLEPIRLEPIRLEPKRLKTKTQKKSDGWRAPNKNQNKPVCRY